MMVRRFGLASLALMALAGCSQGADDPAGKSGGWTIAAGRYSNLSEQESIGLDLNLTDGDQSKTASLRVCDEGCVDYNDLLVMRGLNGLSFGLSHRGRSVDVMVTPASPTAALVSAEWGEALTMTRLEQKP